MKWTDIKEKEKEEGCLAKYPQLREALAPSVLFEHMKQWINSLDVNATDKANLGSTRAEIERFLLERIASVPRECIDRALVESVADRVIEMIQEQAKDFFGDKD